MVTLPRVYHTAPNMVFIILQVYCFLVLETIPEQSIELPNVSTSAKMGNYNLPRLYTAKVSLTSYSWMASIVLELEKVNPEG